MLLLCILLVSACAHEQSKTIETEPMQKEKTLNEIWKELLHNYGQEIARKHSIKIETLAMGFDLEGIGLQVRRYGDFEKPLTQEEIQLIKESFYDYAGQEYSLEIFELRCCNQDANFLGEITKIDYANNKIYIVNHDILEEKPKSWRDVPKENWIKLSGDGRIISGKNQDTKLFGDLRLGQKVQAWSLHYINEHPVKEVVKIELLP
jgi:hypothetical protein